MCEIKWIKITTSMFDDEKIKLIDAMPERDTIHYIWIRLLVQAGKTNANGFIFLNENIPYSEEMMSTIFNRPINSVRLALKTLATFGMIHVYEDNKIKILNWNKHQNIEGMERVKEQNRLRKQRQREAEKKLLEPSVEEQKETSRDGHVTVTLQRERENKNKRESKKEEREREQENIDIENTVEEIDNKDKYDKKNLEDININSITLLQHYETITGIIGGLNIGALKVALKQHGYTYVKIAIDKALEVNKPNMTYINGILRNWAREGYPKEEGVKDNGSSIKGNRGNKNEFTGFKIHESRILTEQERKEAEQQLI